MNRITILLVLSAISLASCADEIPIPDFESKPIKYVDTYKGELLMGERTPEKLKFWFRIVGSNYHQCHMSGIATSRDNETYQYAQNEEQISCALSIIVLENSVVLIDDSNQCRRISCGQRAHINGVVFHRAK